MFKNKSILALSAIFFIEIGIFTVCIKENEIIVCSLFDFGPMVQKEVSFKKIYFSSRGHFVQQSRIICTPLVEGTMGNICKKLFESGENDI